MRVVFAEVGAGGVDVATTVNGGFLTTHTVSMDFPKSLWSAEFGLTQVGEEGVGRRRGDVGREGRGREAGRRRGQWLRLGRRRRERNRLRGRGGWRGGRHAGGLGVLPA